MFREHVFKGNNSWIHNFTLKHKKNQKNIHWKKAESHKLDLAKKYMYIHSETKKSLLKPDEFISIYKPKKYCVWIPNQIDLSFCKFIYTSTLMTYATHFLWSNFLHLR